jgi:hypothetical protein
MIMRFYTEYTNRRRNTHGAGTLAGYGTHTRGWNAGARVTCRDRGDQDQFDVYMTSGSHERGRDVLLGTVKDTPDGPHWAPALDRPGHVPARYGHMEVIAAIPAASHLNVAAPDEYVCVVHAGNWPSGKPFFGTVRAHRDSHGAWSFNDGPGWDTHMSQTEAVTEMVRLTGHERPSAE